MTTDKGATATTETLPAQISQDTAVQPGTDLAEIKVVAFSTSIDLPDVTNLAQRKKSNITTNPDYHEFEQGEVVRGIYLGMGTHKCKDQTTGLIKIIPAAVFVDEKRRVRKNGAAKFRAALENKEMYYEFEAVMTGIKKGKNGNMIQQFEVYDLL